MGLDPMRHPELARLGRTLRRRIDDTLDAEQAAAEAAARRRRSLRDLLLSAEDRADVLIVTSMDGISRIGVVTAVGADHVALGDEQGATTVVAIDHVVAVSRP
jgi:hypothetical protein